MRSLAEAPVNARGERGGANEAVVAISPEACEREVDFMLKYKRGTHAHRREGSSDVPTPHDVAPPRNEACAHLPSESSDFRGAVKPYVVSGGQHTWFLI